MEKIINDYPAYKIKVTGEVFSLFKYKSSKITDTYRPVKPVYDKTCGYNIVTLCAGFGKRQNKRIHRLLMEAFVPNPLGKKTH